MDQIIFIGYKEMGIYKVLYAKKQADVIRNLFWCFIYIFLIFLYAWYVVVGTTYNSYIWFFYHSGFHVYILIFWLMV